MIKNRILLGIWILLTFAGTLIMDNYAIPVIMVLSIIIPFIGVVCARMCSAGLEGEIKSDLTALKGETLNYTVRIMEKGIVGCAHGKAVIEITNLLTGESQNKIISFSVEGKGDRTFTYKLQTEFCGKIRLSLKKLISEDFIGIYNRPVKIGKQTFSLVMPDTFPVEIEMGQGNQCDLNSDEYSMYKSGSDPSETFAIREYRPGDKIKNIHWKLSEKLEELTVRELGLPVNNSVLLIVDSLITDGISFSEKTMDEIGETAISVAQTLCDQQIPFTFSWHQTDSDEMKQSQILNPGQLAERISDVLASGPFEGEEDILKEYENDLGYPEFAHIIVVTGNKGQEDADINDQRNITRLICNEEENPSDKFIYIEV